VIEWTVWDGLSNLRITYPSSTSRLRPTARLVVADRLLALFELSKQSKLIIGQLRHQDLRRFRPKSSAAS
jgi:hypothetical protein